jgi:retinol dehydrogenase-12
VTGGNAGVGKEVARILHSKHARVYVAARSQSKATEAIESIKNSNRESKGSLEYLHLDLNDLTTIKASAQEFLAKENKLHVLFNNAGVMTPTQGSKTAQGYELHLGVNNIAPFMFTKLLTPILVFTAKTEPPNTVRVIWTSSSATELMSPKSAGVPMDNLDYHIEKSGGYKYAVSKAGNYLHSAEFAKRHQSDGVISISLNPGNLLTKLTDENGWLFNKFKNSLDSPPVYGAYTELFAGLSKDITMANSGDWGKFSVLSKIRTIL